MRQLSTCPGAPSSDRMSKANFVYILQNLARFLLITPGQPNNRIHSVPTTYRARCQLLQEALTHRRCGPCPQTPRSQDLLLVSLSLLCFFGILRLHLSGSSVIPELHFELQLAGEDVPSVCLRGLGAVLALPGRLNSPPPQGVPAPRSLVSSGDLLHEILPGVGLGLVRCRPKLSPHSGLWRCASFLETAPFAPRLGENKISSEVLGLPHFVLVYPSGSDHET